MPAFDLLHLWEDRTPRDGPAQMALDEALLLQTEYPILRQYTWTGRWVSFGYSQSHSGVAQSHPDWELVRRWTGGGIVEHASDWTFSLIVPREHAFLRLRPTDSYCTIHQAVARALGRTGLDTTLACPAPPTAPGACFAGQPAGNDVLNPAGQKLCGGAQRRTREGLLHQGSLQGHRPPRDFLALLGGEMAGETNLLLNPPSVPDEIEEKYRSEAWLHRMP